MSAPLEWEMKWLENTQGERTGKNNLRRKEPAYTSQKRNIDIFVLGSFAHMVTQLGPDIPCQCT